MSVANAEIISDIWYYAEIDTENVPGIEGKTFDSFSVIMNGHIYTVILFNEEENYRDAITIYSSSGSREEDEYLVTGMLPFNPKPSKFHFKNIKTDKD
jgi:hypothetical protein